MQHNFSIKQVVTTCLHRINYQSTNSSCSLRICLYRSYSCSNKNVQSLYLPLPFPTSLLFHLFPLAASNNLKFNLKAYFGPGIFRMPPITNERQLFILVQILFQWELEESICLEVLLLLLYQGFLHILHAVKLM